MKMMSSGLSKILMLLLGCLMAVKSYAMPPVAVSEYELKAAYLYNFALFTTWPPEKMTEDGSAIVFCVMAQDAQVASISGLQSKKLRDRSIVVRPIVSSEDGRGCHVLFIGVHGAEVLLPKLLEIVRDAGTLTVTDIADFARKDTVISMAIDNGRLAFDVNLLNARRARLTLSSKLLKLARSVN